MKVFLDECVASRVTSSVTMSRPHTNQMGWTAIRNGELLALASRQFDVFFTVDRNLCFQQNLVAVSVAVIVLRAKSNRLADLRPLLPSMLAAMPYVQPGTVKFLDA